MIPVFHKSIKHNSGPNGNRNNPGADSTIHDRRHVARFLPGTLLMQLRAEGFGWIHDLEQSWRPSKFVNP
jgi:hypothetical protein